MMKMQKSNIVFLDVDGVLNCRLSYIVQKTNSKIVLTSTWKFNLKSSHSGHYLISRLEDYGLSIYECTRDMSFDRGHGIHMYLHEHSNEVANYVIIDDSLFDDYDEELVNHLVLTDFENGLTMENVTKALKILA